MATLERMANKKTEAIAELMLDVAQCFFRIRAAGQKSGLITSWGGGAFGFMRSLAMLGRVAEAKAVRLVHHLPDAGCDGGAAHAQARQQYPGVQGTTQALDILLEPGAAAAAALLALTGSGIKGRRLASSGRLGQCL